MFKNIPQRPENLFDPQEADFQNLTLQIPTQSIAIVKTTGHFSRYGWNIFK